MITMIDDDDDDDGDNDDDDDDDDDSFVFVVCESLVCQGSRTTGCSNS